VKKTREEQLENIIEEIWWMARRYADGRKTYAVGQYNDAIDRALNLDLTLRRDPIADGDGFHAMDGMFDIKKPKATYLEI